MDIENLNTKELIKLSAKILGQARTEKKAQAARKNGLINKKKWIQKKRIKEYQKQYWLRKKMQNKEYLLSQLHSQQLSAVNNPQETTVESVNPEESI